MKTTITVLSIAVLILSACGSNAEGLEKLIKLAEYIKVDYVIYGHTHEKKLLEYHGITYINPGAVSNITPSYALYENGKVTFHQGV